MDEDDLIRSLEEEMPKEYRCENDDCWAGVVLVGRGQDADCPACGWSMAAYYPEAGGA